MKPLKQINRATIDGGAIRGRIYDDRIVVERDGYIEVLTSGNRFEISDQDRDWVTGFNGEDEIDKEYVRFRENYINSWSEI
jgi:hypothetical protein